MHVMMLPPCGQREHSKGTPKGFGGRKITHKSLYFSAREFLLYPEILSEHLNQNLTGFHSVAVSTFALNQNFSELMCLSEYRSLVNRSGVGTKSLTSFQMILILLAHRLYSK